MRIPGGEGRAGAELLGLSPPRAPEAAPGQPSPRWPRDTGQRLPRAGQGERGQPWGQAKECGGVLKAMISPGLRGKRGVRAELLHSHCPGPCGRGGSARSPPRGDIRGLCPGSCQGQARPRAPARCQHSGGDKPRLRDTGDCTWGGKSPQSRGAGRPPGAQRMGHSSTRVQMLVR